MINSFKIDRRRIYLLLLLLVMILMTVGYNLSSYSIGTLILFYLVDKNLIKKIREVNIKMYFPFLFYFSLLLIGLIYTDNMGKGIKLITTSISFLVLPLILLTEKISKNQIFKLLIIYKYWLIVLALYLMVHKVYIQGGPLWTMTLFTLKTEIGIHQLYFSQFYYLGLLIASYQIIKRSKKTVIIFIELLFFIFFIILLGSVTAIIITLLTSLMLIFFFFSKERNAVKGGLITLLFLGVFFVSKTAIVKSKIKKIQTIDWTLSSNINTHKELKEGFGKVNTLNLRFIKWHCAKEIIINNIWFGVGTGDAKDTLVEEYKKIGFKNGIESRYNAHNQYLETFLKFGIFGFLSILLLLGLYFKYAFKHKSFFIFFITLFLSLAFMFESMLERQHGIIFLSLFLPLFYVFNKENYYK
jgi:O-antigen ligase